MPHAYFLNTEENFEEIIPKTSRTINEAYLTPLTLDEARFLNNDAVFAEKAPQSQWTVFYIKEIHTKGGKSRYNVIIVDVRDLLHPSIHGEAGQQGIPKERALKILEQYENKGMTVVKDPKAAKAVSDAILSKKKEYNKVKQKYFASASL